MKKTTIVKAFTLGTSLIVSTCINAQSQSTARIGNGLQAKYYTGFVSVDYQARKIFQQFSDKSFRRFEADFPEAYDLRIWTNRKSAHVTFHTGDSVIRSFYGKMGRLIFSTVAYPSSRLPDVLVDQVVQYFPGYTIFGNVTDVHIDNKTAKLILIENRKTWKRVRMINDYMDIFEEHKKGD